MRFFKKCSMFRRSIPLIHMYFCLFISTFEILINLAILIFTCFKMLLSGVLKLRNAHILPPG